MTIDATHPTSAPPVPGHAALQQTQIEASAPRSAPVGKPSRSRRGVDPSSEVQSLPTSAFGLYLSAAEALCASILDAEITRLVKVRQELVLKSMQSVLVETESRRLRYVEWQLEQVEVARNSGVIRELEEIAAAQRELSATVVQLSSAALQRR